MSHVTRYREREREGGGGRNYIMDVAINRTAGKFAIGQKYARAIDPPANRISSIAAIFDSTASLSPSTFLSLSLSLSFLLTLSLSVHEGGQKSGAAAEEASVTRAADTALLALQLYRAYHCITQ